MIKGVIFDMDGLMFDTERLSTQGWIYCGKVLGINIDLDFINSFKGTGREYSCRLFKDRFGDFFDYEKARKIRTEFMLRYIEENGMPVKKGLIELLEFLKKNNVKCAVATSTIRELAEIYFEKSDVKKYFDAFIYGNMVEKGKPEPDIFIKAIDELKINKEDCIIFEDSPAGIKAGYKAGIKVIAVADMIPLNKDILKMVEGCFGSLDVAVNLINKL